MICKNCGQQIPNGSTVCRFCGSAQFGGQNYYQQSVYGSHRKIDNVFSALVHERTPGAIMEFSLWCASCFVVLLSLIASIVSGGDITWILLMFFVIGMAVLQAFRLKPITMLYGIGTINFILLIIHFVCYGKTNVYNYYTETYRYIYPTASIILFVLCLIAAIAMITFGFIHFFTRYNFGTLLAIMTLSQSFLMLILHVVMYAVRRSAYYLNGYWLGTICIWLTLTIICLLYGFFFWGFIDSRKGKILSPYSSGYSATVPGIRGLTGVNAGRVISLQQNTVMIGSGPGATIPIHDAQVSANHCSIQYHEASGSYIIFDNSTNGVYLSSGVRLQKGNNVVRRGSVIWIGNQMNQFQLL